jgi:hypothetical protein
MSKVSEKEREMMDAFETLDSRKAMYASFKQTAQPRKCESCRHFVDYGSNLMDFCSNPKVVPSDHPWATRGLWPLEKDPMLDAAGLETARDICDRESNGIFVYFEPKTPTAGATFQSSPPCLGGVADASSDGVVVTERAMSAAGGII